MLDSFLNRQNKSSNEEANRVKYMHLMNENGNLLKTIQELKKQLTSLRNINLQLQQNTESSSKAIINQLSQQNYNLEQNMLRLIAYNEELSCDILMKNQLICQNQNQSRQVIANYEEKIYQLRMSLQNKQLTVKNMEQKSIEEKQELYGSTTKVNFMYFNEMNQLKILMDQYSIENAQLKYLNSLKQEQINRITNQLNYCERFLKKSHEWQAHKQALNQQNQMSHTTKDKKIQYKLKLCEQLTRYDLNYKNLSNPNPSHNMTILNKLKSVASKCFHDNNNLTNDKKKLIRNLASKDKEFKILQQAYRKLDVQLRNSWVEIQFYRNNFHELTKVTKQRKIQYYQQIYGEILPMLNKKQRIIEKKSLINYWKAWSKTHDNSLFFDGRRVLNKKSNNRIKCRRNLSCPSKFNYFIESTKKKTCKDPIIQSAIMNFIDNNQQDHGIYNTTIEENRQNNQGDIFNDDPISMIMKPKMFEQNNNFKTAKFLDIDVDLDDE